MTPLPVGTLRPVGVRQSLRTTTLLTLPPPLSLLDNHGVHAQSFPASAQEQLKELDDSGDACLDSKEILAGIRALAREKKKSKRLIWLSAGLLVFSLLLLAAMGGLMFQVNQMLGSISDVVTVALSCAILCR